MAAMRTSAAWQRTLPGLLTFVLVMLVVVCLYFARPVLIPTALAVLFTFLLSPLVTWLQRRQVPRAVAVTLMVLLTGLVVAGVGWLFTSQLFNLIGQLPSYTENVTRRIDEVRGQSQNSLLSKLQEFARDVRLAATRPSPQSPGAPARPDTPVEEEPVEVVVTEGVWSPEVLWAVMAPVLEPIAAAGLVIVLVIFFLLNREDIRNRMISLVGRGQITVTTKALDDAGQRISRYLLAQLVLNASFGVVIGVGLFLLGVPHALLWGVMAGFLRYIPLVGPWMAAVMPLCLSLLLSPGWWQPLGVVALFVCFELISNLVIEPLVYGQSIGVSQSALLLAIAFWTWLWGPMGLVLAAPLTVCLVVLGKHVPYFWFLDTLLGDQPALTAEVQFYQRLLARDQDEASDIAREKTRELTGDQVYDLLFIPALVYAKRDLEGGRLSEAEADYVVQSTREILEEHALAASLEQSQRDDEVPAATPVDAPRLKILGCPTNDEADEVALEMFQRLLDPKVCELEILSLNRLVSEVVAQVEGDRPSIICIAGLPPGGVAHTRLLCKRLRARFPQLKIVVARWGQRSGVDAMREQILASGADHFGTSLEETATQLVQLAQFLRPPATANPPNDGPAVSAPVSRSRAG